MVLRHPVYDPTCGAGDLLLRWANDLPVFPDLKRTIDAWEPLLIGCEIFPEFLRVAKGLGRLAALRLGSKAVLVTRPKEKPDKEYRVVLDWNHFDKAELVEQVELVIEEHAISRRGSEITSATKDRSSWICR